MWNNYKFIRCVLRWALSFQGPKFFNSLNNDVQTVVSISLFKAKLKAFLLS